MEFEARTKNVQEQMRSKGLDVLLIYSWPREWPFSKSGNMRYITNWPGDRDRTRCLAILKTDSPPSLILSNRNYLEMAKEAVWFEDVLVMRDGFAKDSRRLLERSGFEKGVIGVVGMDDLPMGTYHRFKEVFQGSDLVDAEHLILQARRIKSHAEVELIRKAAKICDNAIEAFKKAAAEGIQEHTALAKMEFAALLEGAEQSGSTTASGPYVGSQPTTPRKRKYEAGDGVIIAPVFRFQGYWSQVIRSGVVGTPTREQEKIHEAVQEAERAAINNVKPGKSIYDIRAEALRVLEEEGYEAQKHLHFQTIHGLGLSYLESPRAAFHVEHGDLQIILKPGMVLMVHPNTLLLDKKLGAAIGDVCLVTESGREILSHSDLDLFSV